MLTTSEKLKELRAALDSTKDYFLSQIQELETPVQIYTHIDSDGLSSGAILGKTLYRKKIPFQIRVLRQLEREEIIKIAQNSTNEHELIIFSDFGSGQYIELEDKLKNNGKNLNYIILDHHLPQNVADKDEIEEIQKINEGTSPWHVNPYFFGIDGSVEICGAGMCYYFSRALDDNNIDLSAISIIAAIGDMQNQGPKHSFIGVNQFILKDAKDSNLIEIADDLNFSSIKPLNQAIAYSNDIKLPGLSNDPNKTLKFLQTLGIIMENPEGTIITLNDLTQKDKQKVSSAIIEYSSIKLDIEPSIIIEKLFVNRYLLINEKKYSDLHDVKEFSLVLNACGRTNNGSLGIGIAMGDRTTAYIQAKDNQKNYKKMLMKGLNWLHEEAKIKQGELIQYFFGEDIIPESIVGTISSMLINDNSEKIDKTKPIFGIAIREEEKVYKISARASDIIVNKGVNLSEAIREANELSGINSLGGGHPPAAGTKVPIDKIELFLKNMNQVIGKQLSM